MWKQKGACMLGHNPPPGRRLEGGLSHWARGELRDFQGATCRGRKKPALHLAGDRTRLGTSHTKGFTAEPWEGSLRSPAKKDQRQSKSAKTKARPSYKKGKPVSVKNNVSKKAE